MIINKLRKILDKFFTHKTILFFVFALYSLLIAKSVFSQRTLIPNFDPHPDTFHYIVPARNFAMGGPFAISREGRSFKPSVPPAYSAVLVPFYMINGDARMYYFANVLLSLASIYLFYLIILKLTQDKIILALGLFLYTTNFFIYWVPTLAMAENLSLPLFLLSFYFLLKKVDQKNIIVFSFSTLFLYLTKYANAPLFIVFIFLYLIKILRLKDNRKYFKKFSIISVISIVFAFSFNFFVSGFNPLERLLGFIVNTLIKQDKVPSEIQKSSGSWFSQDYFPKNFVKNFNGIIGGQERFVWDFTPIVSRITALFGFLGIFLSFFNKKLRFICFSLLTLIFSELLFISFFYAVDMRYLYHVIPSLILGFIIFWILLQDSLKKQKLLFYLLILIVGLYLFVTSALKLKNQIVLNLKYSEVPWAYVSILKLNNYFENVRSDVSKPIVISPEPPYLIDFYSNNKYSLLPLSSEQEFRNVKNEAWGENDYHDLITLYNDYLDKGYSLYVSTYGLGVENYLHQDFEKIKENFKLSEIYDECYSQCKLYSLNRK